MRDTHRPARAIKAVHEANIEALAELQAEDDDPNFLRDLRFARGWTLAHVAATTGNGAMLVPLAECGVDLKAATPLGDTVAHTAAYHGCIGALRVLKARVCRSTPRTMGRAARAQGFAAAPRGVRRLVQRRRHHPVLPEASRGSPSRRRCTKTAAAPFLPRSAVAVVGAASVHGPRPGSTRRLF